MNLALAAWSNSFVYAATAVFALAMLAHAAEWAYVRERRTAWADAGSRVPAAVGAGGVATLQTPPTRDAGGGRDAVLRRIGVALTILGTAVLAAGVVSRGLAAGRVPWSNLYEFTTTGACVIALAYLAFWRRYDLGWLGLPLTGFVLVTVVLALVAFYTPVAGLIPALRSYWLVIHVSAACTATAVFSLGAVLSVLQLVRARAERRAVATGAPLTSGYLGRMPSAEGIERVSYRLHAFAFPVWTFALITGAIWAGEAWGRYWNWDPKEVWMFITWVCYAAYLHARATAGWRDRASWVGLVAYAALLFNLVGVNLFLDGLHSYA